MHLREDSSAADMTQSYDSLFLIAGIARWLRMSINAERASPVLPALLASDFELSGQNILQFSKAPWFKKAFKLVPQSHWNQWDLNTCLTLIMFLSILLNWAFDKGMSPWELVRVLLSCILLFIYYWWNDLLLVNAAD